MRCLAVSFVAWSLFAISSTYDFLQMSRVSYVNLPEEKAFHPLQSDMVKVRLQMSGWDVLLKTFKPDTTRLEVDLGGLKTRNFIAFSNQIGFINKQFPVNKQAISVTPDTLYFDFSKQTQKRVPVKPVYGITYRKQYGIVGEIRTNPAFVTITGPAEDVDEIAFIETDSIKGELVDNDVRTVSYLNRNNKANIAIYPTFAEILIPIGEMTEKVIELPIRVQNAESYTSVRTIPGKVKVTLSISLLDYSKWTPRDFEAVVDMDDWAHGRATSLPVQLTKVPPYCQVLRIEPQNIDFFVRL
ncbi:hypothetical protein M8998_00765 [Sphingobacterium sp. lm-10]|uniref:hypothetical protein n=1 Tax=Sphingobacterium sp. lm-10 TaxID=2944904 RepID=UPI0020221119|nr:hypothetical protein [Sphingobacterium sp. lm-10]MCL7986460.1 hypothetical protein [Sphingobacterium sp. lm-10]